MFLKRESGDERVSMSGKDLIFDQAGFSGQLMARRLIGIDEGDMSGWAFSIDSIHIAMLANQFQSGFMNGEIRLPIAKQSLGYSATIDPNHDSYVFAVNYSDTMDVDMFLAKMELLPTSHIEISVVDQKFRPKAVLNGNISIESDLASLPNVQFEELTLQTQAPYLSVKSVGFGQSGAKSKNC